MIRLTLVTAIVLFAAVGLFNLTEQNGSNPLPALLGDGELVTRSAATAPTVLAGSNAQPTAPQPEMANMTAGIVAQIGRATGKAAAPEPVPPVGSELDALTRAVLAGLGAPAEAVQQPSPRKNLADLIDQAMKAGEGDDYVRALIAEAQPQPVTALAPQAASSPADLSELIERALSNEGSDRYLDEVLNAAAESGQIEVPAALRTSDGRIDTRTLLTDIVQKSSGAPAEVRAPTAANSQGVAGVEVRVVQTASETTDALFYTVQTGDSLGAIAQRFYGNASLYQDIFEANRRILSTPDRIRVGQRLVLPDVST